MPIAIGRFESIVPGKRKSGFESIPGKAAGAALTGLLAHTLSAGVFAQTVAPSWIELGAKWNADYTWGDGSDKSPTRMAADDRGNLYVSNGDSLAVGSPSGTEWRTAQVRNEITDWRHTPVIAGPGGSMAWGPWFSDNRGAGWKRISAESEGAYYSAMAIAPGGYCLFGGPMDVIERSARFGDTPVRAHTGATFSRIRDFAVSSSGNAYAAPGFDDLLVSRDSGKTWGDWQTRLKSDPSSPEAANPFLGLLALEPAYPEESLWMAGRRWGENWQALEYVRSGDSLVARAHANLKGPDSAITAFRLQRPANGPIILWVGTWGQGVFRSTDRGESWQAVNSGLKDLHVEAMVEGSQGRIFALTQAGLFSFSGNALGLNSSGKLRPKRLSWRGSGSPFLFRGKDGRGFRPDGRMEMEPAPEKNIRIDRP